MPKEQDKTRKSGEVISELESSGIRLGNRALLIALCFLLCLVACTNSAANATNANAPQTPTLVQKASVPQSDTEEPANLVIVVDSSGSMAARVVARPKIDIAKEVLGKLIEEIPVSMQTGLRAYGHRVKRDCRDTELLVPVGAVEREVFRQRVESMRPLGQTPISYSLLQAAEDLKSKTGKKAIILLSDGKETCGGDPCAVSRELKKANIDFRIHVVGFDITESRAQAQLHCIAESTGGTYFDAKDASQLLSSLLSAVKATTKANIGGQGRLVTTSKDFAGEELKWYIDVFPAGSNQILLSISDSQEPKELPPGKYDLRYLTPVRPEVWMRGVEIRGGQDTRVEIPQFGRLQVNVRDPRGQEVPMYCYVFRAGEEQQVASINYSDHILDLPAGLYDLRFQNIGLPVVRRNGIVIKAGRQTNVEATVNK